MDQRSRQEGDVAERAQRWLWLAGALLGLWALWAALVRSFEPLSSPSFGVLARVCLWGGPSLAYLVSLPDRPWYRPLGLGVPRGPREWTRVVVVPLVVGAFLILGTSHQLGVSPGQLVDALFRQARPRLLAPVVEEVVFRGVLLSGALSLVRDTSRSLAALRWRFWSAELACALVFTLVHWPWWVMSRGWSGALHASPPLLMTGVVLGVIFATTRSLWVCIALHWLNNELSLLVM